MIHLLLPRGQDGSTREYLSTWGEEVADRIRLHYYDAILDWTAAPAGTWVFLALDQLTPDMFRLVCRLHDTLDAAPAPVRILNAPARVRLRLALLDELHRRGINRYRAVSVTGDLERLRYPVFLREEHRHNGAITPLLRSRRELDAALGRALLRGYRIRDLMVTEFHDTVGEDGRYRKYAAYIVGDAVCARALERGTEWMLKHQVAEFTTESLLEERAYQIDNPHADLLRGLFEVAGISYGRMDYAFDRDGGIQVWEINTHPTIGRGPHTMGRGYVPAELRPLRKPGTTAFYRRLNEAWRAVDIDGGNHLVPLDLEADLVRAARAALAAADSVQPNSRWAGLRRALRPLRPVLDPVAAWLLPLVGRAVRRGH